MLAEQDGAITGVLPLAQVKTRLFGNTLISVPFCVYGGPLAADRETAAALEAHADVLMGKTRGLGGRVARPRTGRQRLAGRGRISMSRSASRSRRTTRSNMKAIPRKQRAMVRKGIQNGLTSVCDRDVDVLHRIYAESVRNLGTPVFSRRYFRILAEAFGDCCDVVTVLDGDAAIASVMNFYFRDEVLPYYGGGTAGRAQRAGNDFMYWEVMRRAADRGCRLFDFGRSKLGTGAFAFKHNWGFEPEPLHYRFRLAPGAAIPDHNPLNPKYRLFIAAWKRLPLPVANLIGPPIVRGLG